MNITPIKLNSTYNNSKESHLLSSKRCLNSGLEHLKKVPYDTLVAYSNISFQGLFQKKLTLKRCTKDYLQVSNLASLPLENIHVKFLNKRPVKNAYNLEQLKFPYGSIGMKTGLNELIQSREFYQCAGIGILDKKESSQFLAHIYNGTYVEDIADTLRGIIKSDNLPFDKNRFEISVLPGCEKDTKYTIQHILKALDSIEDGISMLVNYVHFNKKDYDCLSMHNGELFASNGIHRLAASNTNSMFYFNNPAAKLDYARYSKLMADTLNDANYDIYKSGRIYKDFKKEMK